MLQALDARSDVSAGVLATLDRLSDEARSRLDPDVNVRAFLDRLCRDGLYGDAVDVLTHLLPRQMALAWGIECLQEAGAGLPADPALRAGLAAAQRWLAEPSEDHRVAALQLAERLEYKGPGAWIAAAAGWTSGSMLLPGQPEVPVNPALVGTAVGAALRLAAARDPATFEPRIRSFVDRALASAPART